MPILIDKKRLLKEYKNKDKILKQLKEIGWLPLHPSAKLARIVGDLFGDGHLQGPPKWRIDYTSKSIKELKRFEKEVETMFGIKGKIRECKTNVNYKTYNYGINKRAVAVALFFAGVPAGAKTTKPFNLPNWILNNKRFFKEFCKRFFNCEGTVFSEKNKIQIRLEIWKSEECLNNGIAFLSDISNALNKFFKIKSTITTPKGRCNRKDCIITRPIRIYIMGENALKFYEKVGFEGAKQEKLKKVLRLYSVGRKPRKSEHHGNLIKP